MMKLYTKSSIQKLPVSVEEIWNFISNPKNLSVITPKQMGFNTLSGDDREMFSGQIIHYTITPLFGIKMQWVTEIKHVEHNRFFIDEQRFGPYKFWHHKHFIKEIDGGVEMEDVVHYIVPMGILGQIAHPLLVKPNLDAIFEFRRRKLIELFGDFKHY